MTFRSRLSDRAVCALYAAPGVPHRGANAMTVTFKDYKKAANSDQKAFYLLYLDGVREGIIELNVVLEEKRQQPLFCLPDKLTLTVGRAEDIMMRQAEKITDPDQLPIGLLLAEGLKDTFPCQN